MIAVAFSSVLIHNADEVQHEEGYGSNQINNDEG